MDACPPTFKEGKYIKMTISTLQTSPSVIISVQTRVSHSEVNRLLAAAVVNRKFRQLLLSDPVQALEAGYQGEKFTFTRSERDLIVSIQAKSLAELAGQLISCLGINNTHSEQYAAETEIQRFF